jgi:hypothetical protein
MSFKERFFLNYADYNFRLLMSFKLSVIKDGLMVLCVFTKSEQIMTFG